MGEQFDKKLKNLKLNYEQSLNEKDFQYERKLNNIQKDLVEQRNAIQNNNQHQNQELISKINNLELTIAEME